MVRLSVSLEPEQEEWLAERKRELGVSKGKVIRECVDAVRTGDSLLTDPVKSGKNGDDRVASLESRLDALEEQVGAGGGGLDEPESETVRAAADGTVESTADGPMPDEPPAPDDTATADSPGSTESTSGVPDGGSDAGARIPGSVRGDVAGPGAAADSDGEPVADESDPADGGSADGNGRSTAAASGRSAASEPSPRGRGLADEEDEGAETVDVDKSDPDAVRAYLRDAVDEPDLASAVFACWQQLRDRGTVHVRSMHSLYDDYPLGYDDARDWWREAVEPELVTLPGVRSPEGSGKLYRFKY